MSLYLALDTATPWASVALGDDRGAIAEVTIGERRHAAATLPAVEEVLRLAGAQLADLEGIVLADGPGSFTGLRVGFATALGVLHQHPRLTLGLAPSLLALAWRVAPLAEGPVAAVYDALRGEVFAAVYRFAGRRLETLLAPRLTTPAELIRAAPRPALAAGDGATLHASPMLAWTGRAPLGPPHGMPRAEALLQLLDVEGAVSQVPDPTAAEPQYGRLAEAQARWERTHGRPLPHSPGGTG